MREPFFNFYDKRLLNGAWAHTPKPHIAENFFRCLAVCHTVIPDGPDIEDQIKCAAVQHVP